jgi:hypothetical protein
VNPEHTHQWRSALLWLPAAVLLWLIAAVIDHRTEITIESLGGHLRFTVAGTEVLITESLVSVERITIHAADPIERAGALALEIDHDGEVHQLPIDGRAAALLDDPAPVGDWWVDHRDQLDLIFDERVMLEGPFTIQTALGGRFTNDVTISLYGDPTLHFALRRGRLDNYLVIRGSDGAVRDATTLYPTPGSEILAIISQLLRTAAAGCLVIAFVGLIAVISGRAGPFSFLSRSFNRRHRRNPSRRIALLAAIFLAATGSVISIWVAVDILGGLPHQIDEVVYLLQARWLLDGNIAPAASEIQEHLRVPLTYLVDGHWIGHYSVGWPAILAGGLAVGVPHLVSPMIGFAFILLLFLVGREIDDEITGLAAAALAVVSPLARLLSGSMFPHAACAVLVLLALWFLLLSRRLPWWWTGAAAGAAMGCCLAVRPMTAVAASVVLGGWLVVDALLGEVDSRSRWLTLAWAAGAGLVSSLPTLVHNTVVTGRWWSLPYSFAEGSMYGLDNTPFGIRNLDAILHAASAGLTGWGWPLASGGFALALSLAFVGIPFLLRRTRPEDRLLLVLFVVIALGHLPTRANGLHGYGARYFFDAAACLYLLSARGFRELARWALPSGTAVTAVAAIFLALNLTALAALPSRLALYRGYYEVTGELERQLAASGLTEAIILIDGDHWEPWGESARLMTGPRRHEIIIAADLDDNSALEKAYPGWPVFRWNGEQLQPDSPGDS